MGQTANRLIDTTKTLTATLVERRFLTRQNWPLMPQPWHCADAELPFHAPTFCDDSMNDFIPHLQTALMIHGTK